MRRLLAFPFLLIALVSCTGGVQTSPASSTTAPPELEASFTIEIDQPVTKTTSCPVEWTIFKDTSRGSPTSCEREFPDGTTSSEQSPRVRGRVWGTVRLTVSNGADASSAEREVPVTPEC